LVEGEFLVTLEHIKELGKGHLLFSASVIGKSYFRKTSLSVWETAPVSISISVVAEVERLGIIINLKLILVGLFSKYHIFQNAGYDI